jgi:hypothetical protein
VKPCSTARYPVAPGGLLYPQVTPEASSEATRLALTEGPHSSLCHFRAFPQKVTPPRTNSHCHGSLLRSRRPFLFLDFVVLAREGLGPSGPTVLLCLPIMTYIPRSQAGVILSRLRPASRNFSSRASVVQKFQRCQAVSNLSGMSLEPASVKRRIFNNRQPPFFSSDTIF